jgi:anion-transporting  ArsA/GET3 family ATPase
MESALGVIIAHDCRSRRAQAGFRDTAATMQSALDRKLLVVTGKGGTGKTTIAAALGLLSAARGRRTIVVEVGEESRLPSLFGIGSPRPGVETRLQEGLSSISIDPDRALREWLQVLGGRVPGRVLASSSTFQYFTAAAPGAKELVTMVKVWQLTQGGGRRGRSAGYDLVVLDAPATGHALGMLGSPRTFGAIARVGPIAGQTRQLQELLESPARSAYLAVALATEMAVTEALELQDGLRTRLGRGLEAVVVNALLPRRFTAPEMRRILSLGDAARGERTSGAGPPSHGPLDDGASGDADVDQRQAVTASAANAARAVHERSRLQHNQLARLRRRSFDVLAVPHVWGAQLDLSGVSGIARRLERQL